jgi:plastocyanin
MGMNTRKYLPLASLSLALLLFLVAIPAATLRPVNAQDATLHNSDNTHSVAANTGIVVDTSPNAAVIFIGKDASGNVVFQPSNITIKIGEEILILNNDTAPQSFTNGKGRNDPNAGTIFDTGLIQPNQFVEYTAVNLRQGQYPFYSEGAASAVGTLTVVGIK